MIHQLLNLTRPLIIPDLETTSVDKTRARTCSLAMRVWKPNGQVDVYKTLINPGVPIPKEASDVHGITVDTLTGCAKCWAPAASHPHSECDKFWPVPFFSDIAPRLHAGFSNADFAGYNVRFDLEVLQREFELCKLVFDYSQSAIIDSFRLWQIMEPRTLTDAAQHFADYTLDNAHNAMADVEATEHVLIGQLTKHTKAHVLPKTVSELGALCFPRDSNWIDVEGKFAFINGVPCLNFGKHKGRPMRECKDYLRWMFGAQFSPEVKRICDDALAGKYPTQASSPVDFTLET